MQDTAKLRKLYDLTCMAFPYRRHDSGLLLEKIRKSLLRDPIRTSSTRRWIEKEGLELELDRQWPLNDFLYGLEKYLIAKKVSSQKVYDWTTRIRAENLVFQD